jgi:hypothetical protein
MEEKEWETTALGGKEKKKKKIVMLHLILFTFNRIDIAAMASASAVWALPRSRCIPMGCKNVVVEIRRKTSISFLDGIK